VPSDPPLDRLTQSTLEDRRLANAQRKLGVVARFIDRAQ
jgi:hypothetical protein